MPRLTLFRATSVRTLAKAEYVYDPSGAAPFTIGRSEASSMLLSSDGQKFNISRRHAEVRYVDATGTFVLVDLGSMNGVFLNGVRIDVDTPSTLRENDVVTFGGGANVAAGQKVSQPKSEFRFRVIIEQSAASAALSPPPAKRARLGRSSGVRTAVAEERIAALESQVAAAAAESAAAAAAAAAPTKAKLAALESELKASRAAASSTLAAELAKQRSVQETAAKAAASCAAMEAERARAAGAAKLAQLKAELVQARERAKSKEAEAEHERAAKASACERQEELLSCGVCMDLLVHTLVLTCGHSYCAACWHDWRARKEADAAAGTADSVARVVCPWCCRPVVPGSAVPGRVIDDNVELFVQQLAVEDERRVAYEERLAAARVASNAASAAAAADAARLAAPRDGQRVVKRAAAREAMAHAGDLRHFFIDLT